MPGKFHNKPLYQRLSSLLIQRKNCEESGNTEWFNRSTEEILDRVKNLMPHGGGIDNGTKIDLEKSHGELLVFHTSFHHMDEHGFYDGWTEHTVTVKASLFDGISIKVTGRDRNQIKEYLYDRFQMALTCTV